MSRVLIAEDEPRIAAFIEKGLLGAARIEMVREMGYRLVDG